MLKVMFGKQIEGTNTDVDAYFDNMYEYDWFTKEDPIIVQMVKDIDNSDLVGMCVLSPYLGSIPLERLSGGVKGLILLYKLDDFVTDLIMFGNNCEDWLIRLSEMKDITVCMTGYDMRFTGKDIKALCLNDNTMINGSSEWVHKMIEFGEDYYDGLL